MVNEKHMFSKYTLRAHNILLIILVLSLNVIGILVLSSAVNGDNSLIIRQVIGSVIGLVLCLLVSLVDYNRYSKLYILIYIGAIIILLLVLVAGVVRRGAGRWIILPGIGQVQPAELVKLCMVIYLASYLDKNNQHVNKALVLFKLLVFLLIPLVLIFIEPNLSTTIILAVILAAMLFSCGLSLKWILFFTVTAGALIALVLYLFNTDNYDLIPFIQDYQKERILGFLHPDEYSDTYLQQENSVTAIASGGFFGKGLYNTDVVSVKSGNFLIEEETDFIFAIIGEELGFRGCVLLLCVYIAIVILLLRIASKAKNITGEAICVGIAVWIGFQAFTNVAVATSVFPNTGVTLPFISRGVSSLLALYIAIGVTLNVGFQSVD